MSILGDPRPLYREFDLSTYVEEIPTSYVCVVGQFERGPMWKETVIGAGDTEKFRRKYGNEVDWTQDPICCIKALENKANLIIRRIGHCTDINDRSTCDILPASCLIPDRGGQPTAGAVQSGTGPFTITEALSGRVTGTEIGPYSITTDANDKFQIRLGQPGDWATEQTVALQAGTRTAQQVCDDINSGTSGLNATVSTDGKIYLEAINADDDIEIMAVANDAYSALGFAEAVYAHTAGTDYLAISIDGGADQEFTLVRNEAGTGSFQLTAAEIVLQIATIVGATVTHAAGVLTVRSDTTGTSSSVQVQATSTAAAVLGFDSDPHAGTEGEVKYPWKAEMIGPGSYGNATKLYVYDEPLDPGVKFRIKVVCPGNEDEVFRDLVRDPDSNFYWINYLNANSELIKIVDGADEPNAAPFDLPALNSDGYAFSGGDDGTLVLQDNDWIGTSTGKNGFHCIDNTLMPFIDVMLFGTHSAEVTTQLHTWLANRKGTFGWTPTPPGQSEEEAAEWRMGLATAGWAHAPFNTWEAAGLRGRVTVYNTRNNAKEQITALPYLAGAICQTDAVHGRAISPFGIENGPCPDAYEVDDNPVEDRGGADLLHEYQLNNVREFGVGLEGRGNEGIYLWGGQTWQRAASALREVPVARKIKEYEWLLYPIGLRFINRPNHPVTWREVHLILDPMLREDLNKYQIYGYALITDKNAYFSAEGELKGAVLQTGRDIDHGIYRCRILIQPLRQIFYFVFELGAMRTGEAFVNYSTMYQLPGWLRKAA